MCEFSPRLRKKLKIPASHSGKKNFEKISKNPFFGTF
jgi:hypothetical protein